MERGLPETVVRRTTPLERYGLRLTLALGAVFLVTVPFSFLLFQVLLDGPLTRVDGDVADDLNRAVQTNDTMVTALQAVSGLGRPAVLGLVVIVAVLGTVRRGAPRLALFILATSVGGGLLTTGLKVLVDRPRPVVDHPVAFAFGKSFPSGHALSSTVVYGAVLLAFLPVLARHRRRLAVALVVVLVLAVGASRVLLGVHFLSDVVAGHVLGVAWLAAATAVFEIWRLDRGRQAGPPGTPALAVTARPAPRPPRG